MALILLDGLKWATNRLETVDKTLTVPSSATIKALKLVIEKSEKEFEKNSPVQIKEEQKCGAESALEGYIRRLDELEAEKSQRTEAPVS